MERLKVYILSVALLVLSWTTANAQPPGFNGHMITASLGFQLNSAFIQFGPNGVINDSRVKSYLPPKMNVSLEFAITQRNTISLSASFYPMPHTQFFLPNASYARNTELLIVDSVMLKSNMYGLCLGTRRYADFTHYGKFIDFGVSGNYYNTEIFPTRYRKQTVNGVVTLNEVEKYEPGRQWTYNYSFYFGKGRKYVFPNNVTIDYGARFWLFIGGNNSFTVGEDYRDELENIVDFLMYKRSQEAHLIELFVNIGILK